MGNRKYKESHREKGICVDCNELAEPGKTRCKFCNQTVARNQKRIDASRYTPAEIEKILGQNATLMQSLEKERFKTRQIVDACSVAVSKLNIKPVSAPKHQHAKKKQDLEFHLLRSDEQVGEVVQPELTSGLGVYNFDIYKQRVLRLADKVATFWEQDRYSLGLKKLVSPQLGDHVGGENIFKGQGFYIDMPLVDQVFQSAEFEANNFWLPMAKMFEEIELYCIPGNHGRPGGKGENHQKTNFDYIYYHVLKMILERSASHIKVYVSECPIMLVEHGKHLFCYKHGDDVNSWMGIPYYGLDRSAKSTSAMFRKIIKYTCVAHFHSPANLNDTTLVNGTLVGGSTLSINRMGLTSVPSQKMFYLDLEKGINRESNLYLEDPVNLQADEHGIYTPYK